MGKDAGQFVDEKLIEAESKLSKKTEQFNKLQAEIADLKDRINVLKSLRDEVPGIESVGSAMIHRKHKQDPSTADYVFQLMSQGGGKMHVRDIAASLINEGKMNPNVQHPQASVHSALSRRKETFELLGNGFWRIKTKSGEEDDKDEIVRIEKAEL